MIHSLQHVAAQQTSVDGGGGCSGREGHSCLTRDPERFTATAPSDTENAMGNTSQQSLNGSVVIKTEIQDIPNPVATTGKAPVKRAAGGSGNGCRGAVPDKKSVVSSIAVVGMECSSIIYLIKVKANAGSAVHQNPAEPPAKWTPLSDGVVAESLQFRDINYVNNQAGPSVLLSTGAARVKVEVPEGPMDTTPVDQAPYANTTTTSFGRDRLGNTLAMNPVVSEVSEGVEILYFLLN